MEWKEKASKMGTELILGYINSLGADLTNRFLFGSGEDESLKRIEALLRENKIDEARAAVSSIQGSRTSIGQTDEEMMLQDISEIHRLGLVTQEKFVELVTFLAALTPAQRRRIRKGNMVEANPIARQNKFADLANAPNDTARIAILNAAGYNDPTELERLQAWDQQTFAVPANDAEAAANVRVDEARQAITGPRVKRRGFGWLNPFR